MEGNARQRQRASLRPFKTASALRGFKTFSPKAASVNVVGGCAERRNPNTRACTQVKQTTVDRW